MLKSGGILYIEDYYRKGNFTADEASILENVVSSVSHELDTLEAYQTRLEKAGFNIKSVADTTDAWNEFTFERCNNFKASFKKHVNIHGVVIAEGQLNFVQSVSDVFQSGNLGGCRLVAVKN
jgi:hypothetical protein